MAQSALETGRWKHCHCWNLGNVKSSFGDGRDFTFFRCNEVLSGKTVWFDPPHPYTRFRAFRTLAEGAVDHLAFLRGLTRYKIAWQWVMAGDPHAFVQALKAAGYFTADEAPYERSVASLFNEFSHLPFDVEPRPGTVPPPAIDDETRERVLGLVAMCRLDLSLRDTEPPTTDDPTAV
jgi:flagellum-specific peptidoglycan hydrolase FlgJ